MRDPPGLRRVRVTADDVPLHKIHWCPRSPQVHHGVTCDQCSMCPVRGKRWKALDRYDYDLCETCHKSRPEEEQERYHTSH